MRILDSYYIKRHTIAIIPVYDNNGNLYSFVLQGTDVLFVRMSPIKIIERSLLHYGSSIQGACTGSRSVLGNVKMIPIRISGELEMYWFPSSAPRHNLCVWFSQAHILRSIQKGDQTYVYLTSGHTILVDMKKTSFDRKLEKATLLRHIQSERNKFADDDDDDDDNGFDIWKDPGNLFYEIKGIDYVHEMESSYQGS